MKYRVTQIITKEKNSKQRGFQVWAGGMLTVRVVRLSCMLISNLNKSKNNQEYFCSNLCALKPRWDRGGRHLVAVTLSRLLLSSAGKKGLL